MKHLELYIKKSTDLMFPLLLAHGVAELVYQLSPPDQRDSVLIQDDVTYYTIRSDASKEAILEYLKENDLPHLIPAISKPLSGKEKKQISAGVDCKQIRRYYIPDDFTGDIINYKNVTQEAGKLSEHRGIWDDALYPIWAHLCSYYGNGSTMTKTYPLLVNLWHLHASSQSARSWLIRSLLDTLEVLDNDLRSLSPRWAKEAKQLVDYSVIKNQFTARGVFSILRLALVSPGTVKGTGTSDHTKRFSPQKQSAYWLEMYLAIAGLIAAGFPFNFGTDISVFIPFWHKMPHSMFRQLIRQLRDTHKVKWLYRNSSSCSANHLRNMLYFKFIFKNHSNQLGDLNQLQVFEARYKHVNSHIPWGYRLTLASDSLVRLQKQFPSLLKSVLEKIAASIDLPRLPKDEFTAAIASFIGAAHADNWLRLLICYLQENKSNRLFFSYGEITKVLIRLEEIEDISLPKKQYADILKNPHFKNLAKVINSCTVHAMYLKHEKKQAIPYEIRINLDSTLLENAHDTEKFLRALLEFLTSYEKESSHLLAKAVKRPIATYEDILGITELIDEFGSEMIARLLVVAAYSTHFPEKLQSNDKSKNESSPSPMLNQDPSP